MQSLKKKFDGPHSLPHLRNFVIEILGTCSEVDGILFPHLTFMANYVFQAMHTLAEVKNMKHLMYA